METNPYRDTSESSTFAYPPPVEPAKPAAATVFGILNIVFGILGLCGSVFSFGALFVVQAAMQNNPAMEIMAQHPAYRMFQMGALALGFVATIVLIIAGVGLLQLQPYGRFLSIGYGIYAIIAGIIGITMSLIFVVGPLMQRFQQLPPGPERAGAIGGIIGGTVGGVVGLIYPALLLFFMYRPNIIAAFRR